eukprot:TRINITY_DN28510_c0_g1_i2.p1 TRINITY_DN28510_c0_g1~~TRINITY_DN28510_c0_g1_i2.p1  ORF type:complete len:348 (+),score=86.77 TRINITY_DN28510_c0_g1_i2:79-1122(+)
MCIRDRDRGDVYDDAVAHASCWAPNDKQKFFRKEVQTDGFGTVTMGEFEWQPTWKIKFVIPVYHSRTDQVLHKYVRKNLPAFPLKIFDAVYPYAKPVDFVPGAENKIKHMEYAIYKGMDVAELRLVLARTFWQFKHEWQAKCHLYPSYFVDEAGTNYPFSLLAISPEQFGEGVYSLPGHYVDDAAYDGARWHVWRVWLKKDGYSIFFSTWPATFVSCWLILEVCRFFQNYLSLGSNEMVSSFLSFFVSRSDFLISYLVVGPLKHVYRNGPAIATPFGEIGFWGGRHISAACAGWSGSAGDLWRKHPELCETLFAEKEEQFSTAMLYLIMGLMFYTSVLPVLKCLLLK